MPPASAMPPTRASTQASKPVRASVTLRTPTPSSSPPTPWTWRRSLRSSTPLRLRSTKFCSGGKAQLFGALPAVAAAQGTQPDGDGDTISNGNTQDGDIDQDAQAGGDGDGDDGDGSGGNAGK